MARFTRIQVYNAIIAAGVVPIFYDGDKETVAQVVNACYAGGMRVFEFTNRGDFAHEIFSETVKHTKDSCPEMILGAGSIVDSATAALFLQSGANFIVSPLTCPDIFKVCNRRQTAYIPGCGSASEIGYAQESGAEIVKIFPADSVGGPSFVKSVKAPMPWTNVMVTGGVEPTEDDLKKWFDAGAICVGIGSSLFPKAVLSGKDWPSITQKCKETVKIIEKIKSKTK